MSSEPFESWDKLIRETFLIMLKAAEEAQPGTLEWTAIWSCLHHYKTYAEAKNKGENE